MSTCFLNIAKSASAICFTSENTCVYYFFNRKAWFCADRWKVTHSFSGNGTKGGTGKLSHISSAISNMCLCICSTEKRHGSVLADG